MARTMRMDERLKELEKIIKDLETENAELKKQIEKLKPKQAHYKGPKVKEHYSTTKVKKDAVQEVHEED